MAADKKSYYYTARTKLHLTREQASEKITALKIPPDRLEKIENGRVIPHADEILAIAEAYNTPEMINYYCRHDCEIGAKHVAEVIPKDLPQIAIETINSLNRLDLIKNRLLEIVEDGKVTPDEELDFKTINSNLEKIVSSANSLRLWIQQNKLS